MATMVTVADSTVDLRDEQDDSHSTDSKESGGSKDGGAGFGRRELKKDSKRSKSATRRNMLMLTKPSINRLKEQQPLPAASAADPERFFGEGIIFKAKLIGVKDVSEARGDKMAQDALQELKSQVKSSGGHKLRININISVDGVKLKEDKSGEVLYQHPVHRISFIAQDITDSRAFGYIHGCSDGHHKFYAIKTEKAAQQVVITMRDLFQVMFEQKRREIELAKQMSHRKKDSDGKMDKGSEDLKSPESAKCDASELAEAGPIIGNLLDLDAEVQPQSKQAGCEGGFAGSSDPFGGDPWGGGWPESTEHIQAKMDGVFGSFFTPSEFSSANPFYHSSAPFSAFPPAPGNSTAEGSKNDPFPPVQNDPFPPPPFAPRRGSCTTDPFNTSFLNNVGGPSDSPPSYKPPPPPPTSARDRFEPIKDRYEPPQDRFEPPNNRNEPANRFEMSSSMEKPDQATPPPVASADRYAVFAELSASFSSQESSANVPSSSAFETGSPNIFDSSAPKAFENSLQSANSFSNISTSPPSGGMNSYKPSTSPPGIGNANYKGTVSSSSSITAEVTSERSPSPQTGTGTSSPPISSVFSELDPLGKDKPFIDKKHFFADVKNPPKKAIRDLINDNKMAFLNAPYSTSNTSEFSSSDLFPSKDPFNTDNIFPDPNISGSSNNVNNPLSVTVDENAYGTDTDPPSPVGPPPPPPPGSSLYRQATSRVAAMVEQAPPTLPPRPPHTLVSSSSFPLQQSSNVQPPPLPNPATGPPLPPKRSLSSPASSELSNGSAPEQAEIPTITPPIPIPSRRPRISSTPVNTITNNAQNVSPARSMSPNPFLNNPPPAPPPPSSVAPSPLPKINGYHARSPPRSPNPFASIDSSSFSPSWSKSTNDPFVTNNTQRPEPHNSPSPNPFKGSSPSWSGSGREGEHQVLNQQGPPPNKQFDNQWSNPGQVNGPQLVSGSHPLGPNAGPHWVSGSPNVSQNIGPQWSSGSPNMVQNNVPQWNNGPPNMSQINGPQWGSGPPNMTCNGPQWGTGPPNMAQNTGPQWSNVPPNLPQSYGPQWGNVPPHMPQYNGPPSQWNNLAQNSGPPPNMVQMSGPQWGNGPPNMLPNSGPPPQWTNLGQSTAPEQFSGGGFTNGGSFPHRPWGPENMQANQQWNGPPGPWGSPGGGQVNHDSTRQGNASSWNNSGFKNGSDFASSAAWKSTPNNAFGTDSSLSSINKPPGSDSGFSATWTSSNIGPGSDPGVSAPWNSAPSTNGAPNSDPGTTVPWGELNGTERNASPSFKSSGATLPSPVSNGSKTGAFNGPSYSSDANESRASPSFKSSWNKLPSPSDKPSMNGASRESGPWESNGSSTWDRPSWSNGSNNVSSPMKPPDIFNRQEDPFADDFFSSLPEGFKLKKPAA